MMRILKKAKQLLRLQKQIYFDKFIFIHINKTAGSSVEKALRLPFEHKTALEKIDEIGRHNWDQKLTFTIVRNPWDKVVSHYHYRVKTNQTDLGVNTLEFNEWVKRAYGNKDSFYYDNPKMFMPQLDWISDENGVILVDEIIHFEKLDTEFTAVLEKIGKRKKLPHVKKSNRSNYRDYYNDETIEIVKVWFDPDIKEFNYTY